jgi:hypothetical protein
MSIHPQYIQNPFEEFLDYLASKWGGNFHHGFPITNHPAWSQWREICPDRLKNRWECANLREASERYSWAGEGPGKLVARLQDALKSNNTNETRDACLAIFKWGNVARKVNDASRVWIGRPTAELPLELKRAVALLKDPEAELLVFNGTDLLMNSAMTKIYWAADPDKQLAIYDGRVGAALGLLVREFLKSKSVKEVPAELQFRWGRSSNKYVPGEQDMRDPSQGYLQFPPLFRSTRKDYHHARMMRDASFLFQSVVRKLKNKVAVHEIEKSLFMIGYDVSGSPNS